MSLRAMCLRGFAEALVRRALALHPTSPAIHAPRRHFCEGDAIARLHSRMDRWEMTSIERHSILSTALGRANAALAGAANTAADRASKDDLDALKVAMRVAFSVLGLTVGGGVAAVFAFRYTTERATRDCAQVLVS
ncbi:hypothetical protein D1007_14445 [Hordeum vulgare]|uniref:uncharacterized protein LOC123425849 n=1 Tax=Hordeum vulgare subsp. vulgare TaxID=112509 RepID=UPI001D1A3753|nr:uncharacterized protein LOC123425849 [Hordeum vulgare subsp. vulgare]KAE8809017.1 hypothetical protein D1007_14445 [Hordeum vulgare]